MATPFGLIPITLLTGFLGSGKTTVLNQLVAQPEGARLAVLINEFGEVAIDHLLVRDIKENLVVLDSGCLCCSVRGDLITALRDLAIQRARQSIPEFDRVIIETTGLADPVPILHTLLNDPLLAANYRFDAVVTTVDAELGNGQLDRQRESVKQAAMADVILLTKSDRADSATRDALTTRLAELNPGATLILVEHGRVSPGRLFEVGLVDPARKALAVDRWLRADRYPARVAERFGARRHEDHVRSVSFRFDQPLDREAFAAALDMLLSFRGEQLLRLKAILDFAGEPLPVVVQAAQHVVYPEVRLPEWPDASRGSRLVVIVRDLDPGFVEQVFREFQRDAALLS